MSRTPIAFHADDISGLARILRKQLTELEKAPSHVELLNMLAQATGFQNFQHLRAKATSPKYEQPAVSIQKKEDDESPAFYKRRMERLLRCFDNNSRLIRWPKRRAEQILVLWVLWSRIPHANTLSEKDINSLLNEWHSFGDYALLRRELWDFGLMKRTPDGRIYRRMEAEMPPDALDVQKRLNRQSSIA